ncbi:MAG: hypothetical protein OEV66_11125 [Spirochaetia bacterium]|nr:hypothetical protein [Spirochaetia bacterium]
MDNNIIKQFLARFFLLLAILLPSSAAYSAESDILREIKNLREDTASQFKTLREDTKSEIITLREDMDKRFNLLMWFIGLWIPLSMAVVGYILQCLNRHDDRFFEISKKTIEAEDMISAINRASPETRKRLKEALKG